MYYCSDFFLIHIVLLFFVVVKSQHYHKKHSFASTAPAQRGHQLAKDMPPPPPPLDGSAILSDSEEFEDQERLEMHQDDNDGMHIGQHEEHSDERDERHKAAMASGGMNLAKVPSSKITATDSDSAKASMSASAVAAPQTIVGPMPPLPTHRTAQKAVGENFHLRYRTNAKMARAFASGRYEAPAQRPPMLPRMPSHQPDESSSGGAIVSATAKQMPSPQLSFRSPIGHYAPLWSPTAGAAFAVPSPAAHLGGIAYYAPNSELAAAVADERRGTDAAHSVTAAGQLRRPPVLLIGAFPPSAKFIPAPSSSHPSSHYSPPNPPLVEKHSYANSPHAQPFVVDVPSVRQNASDDFGTDLPVRSNSYQASSKHRQYETSPISPHFLPQYEHFVGPTLPPTQYLPSSSSMSYFPTLVSTASPPVFTLSPQHSVGRFIPGRPYQPNRSGGAGGGTSTTTLPATTTTTTTPTMAPPKMAAPRGDCEQTETDIPPMAQPTEGPKQIVPNRSVGKARIKCEENGVEFGLRTVFPFTGQIFAYDKKRIAGCFHSLNNERNISIRFSFIECGIQNRHDNNRFSPTTMEQFHLQIVVQFHQQNGTSNVQSYFVQCGQNRIQTAPELARRRHIEEALDELHIVPIELEQKAPLPIPTMRFFAVGDADRRRGQNTAAGVELMDGELLHIGQLLSVEFALQPATEAFGFLVKNCVVRDALSGAEHEVIDSFGCSADLSIFGHPRYDTFNDVARAHWHAFKLPDQSLLSLKCRFVVCTDLGHDSDNNNVPNGTTSSCAALPSPPFCPDLATSPSDSVLADLSASSSSAFARRSWSMRLKRRTHSVAERAGGDAGGGAAHWASARAEAEEQRVHVSLSVSGSNGTRPTQRQRGGGRRHEVEQRRHEEAATAAVTSAVDNDGTICAVLSLASPFCAAFLLLALAANLFCRCTQTLLLPLLNRRKEEQKQQQRQN